MTLSLPHLAGGKRAVSFVSRDSVHLVSSSQVIAITVLGQIKVVSSEKLQFKKEPSSLYSGLSALPDNVKLLSSSQPGLGSSPAQKQDGSQPHIVAVF